MRMMIETVMMGFKATVAEISQQNATLMSNVISEINKERNVHNKRVKTDEDPAETLPADGWEAAAAAAALAIKPPKADAVPVVALEVKSVDDAPWKMSY